MATMDIEIRPNSKVGVGMLIPQVARDGMMLKVDVYGGEMYEADETGTVAQLEDFAGTFTFNFSNLPAACAAESIVKLLSDEDTAVVVRLEEAGHYGSITDPVTGVRVATGRPA